MLTCVNSARSVPSRTVTKLTGSELAPCGACLSNKAASAAGAVASAGEYEADYCLDSRELRKNSAKIKTNIVHEWLILWHAFVGSCLLVEFKVKFNAGARAARVESA